MTEIPNFEAVERFFALLSYYGYAGALFAAVFLTVGLSRFDPGARGSYLFRILLIPASVALWPVLLWRWIGIERSGETL